MRDPVHRLVRRRRLKVRRSQHSLFQVNRNRSLKRKRRKQLRLSHFRLRFRLKWLFFPRRTTAQLKERKRGLLAATPANANRSCLLDCSGPYCPRFFVRVGWNASKRLTSRAQVSPTAVFIDWAGCRVTPNEAMARVSRVTPRGHSQVASRQRVPCWARAMRGSIVDTSLAEFANREGRRASARGHGRLAGRQPGDLVRTP
jgi:hypothetical protein